MMPKEPRRRGAALRVAAVVVAGGLLVYLGTHLGGPLATGSAATAPAAGSPASAAVASAASPSAPVSPVSTLAAGPSPVGPSPFASIPPASGDPATPLPTATPDPVAAQDAKLQRTLDVTRAKLSIPGVSVAILWDNGRSWVGASGMRNVATADPMTTGTAFALASISKTFTAAVVLQLVDEGKLSLDQHVAPLLPAYRLDGRITVRMLLDHTSGLPDFFLGKGIDAALRSATAATWTAARSWSYVPKPHAVPGRSWNYSNTNYLLLGALVETITSDTLAHEIRARLLDPLGLGTAWYQAVETPLEAGTQGYSLIAKAGGGFRAVPVARMSDVMPFRSVITAAGGAGSIASTALDAARWMQTWARGKLLSPALAKAMLADVATTVKLHAAIPYGLGIQRVQLGGWTALGHSGRYLGFRNVVRYLPAAGITIAVLTNQTVWDPSRVATALLKIVAPPLTPAPSASPGSSGLSGSPSAPAPSPTPAPS